MSAALTGLVDTKLIGKPSVFSGKDSDSHDMELQLHQLHRMLGPNSRFHAGGGGEVADTDPHERAAGGGPARQARRGVAGRAAIDLLIVIDCGAAGRQ